VFEAEEFRGGKGLVIVMVFMSLSWI